MKMSVRYSDLFCFDWRGFLLNTFLGWRNPIQPQGAEDLGDDYDLLEAIQDEPVS
jgi:hypothetical protein